MAVDETVRTEGFLFGIAGAGLGEVQRQIPSDEPPPLPANAALAVIGKSIPRQNGRAKVTGATPFTVDVTLPGMLHARILRSPLPHAQLRAIDISVAARHPGVRAILLIARPEDPSGAILRHVGAPVAAVAAISIAAATAPAIANAVYNAIGVRLRTLPMTPASVLAALGKIPSRS